ncbi:MAG: hypothetical protein J6N52_12470 [Clostridia bacterium]|nr:hypothetical protein [Clostridia bacterium]
MIYKTLTNKVRYTLIFLVLLTLSLFFFVISNLYNKVLLNDFNQRQMNFCKQYAQSLELYISFVDERINFFIFNHSDILTDNSSSSLYELNSAMSSLINQNNTYVMLCSKGSLNYYPSTYFYQYFSNIEKDSFFKTLDNSDRKIISFMGAENTEYNMYVRKIPNTESTYLLCQINTPNYSDFYKANKRDMFFNNSIVHLSANGNSLYLDLHGADNTEKAYFRENYQKNFSKSNTGGIYTNYYIEALNTSVLVYTEYTGLRSMLLNAAIKSFVIFVIFSVLAAFIVIRYTHMFESSLSDLDSQMQYYINNNEKK